MSLTKSIAAEFLITDLEARELETKSLELGQKFIVLRSIYSVDHVTETENYFDQKALNDRKTGMMKFVGVVRNQLSHKTKKMWLAYTECEAAKNSFNTVWRTHSLKPHFEETLTKCFELAHQSGKLRNPEQVLEGRRVFDALAKMRVGLVKYGVIKGEG